MILLLARGGNLLFQVILRPLTPLKLTYFSCNVGFSSLPGKAKGVQKETLERLI